MEEQVSLELYRGAKVYLRCTAHPEFIRAVSCICLLGRGCDSSTEKTVFRNTTCNENTRSWLYPSILISYESSAKLIDFGGFLMKM